MSEVQYFADNDYNDKIVDGVLAREPTVKVVRAREVGMRERSDEEVLAYAAENSLIVLSHDVSTLQAAAYRRIAAGEPMPGVFLAIQRKPIGPIIENLVLIWAATELEEWEGRVLYLPLE